MTNNTTTASAGFPLRTIHLDFHTGPATPEVGRDFDAAHFAQIFKDAHVDSVTVFAKCHHGHMYYNTSHPARHPTLPHGMDLLGQQIDALHRLGIRAPIYLSGQCDEFAANTHPDWVAMTPELKQVKWSTGPFDAGWQILDMSSPYQDYLADQLAEVLRLFAPVDGIFLDMLWDQVSCTKWAIDGMKRQGLDPREPADRDCYAHQVALGFMARYRKMIENAKGGQGAMGVWFNSRPKINLYDEKHLVHHVEIEALPTGGWGYA
ncbi:MAG: alpha-L-fucosidase, partial [Phycisphaerae bacterium]